jgi:hypothetical protein
MPKLEKNRRPGKPFKPGEGGRPKGAVNRFTSLKQSFLDAFEETGGTEGLKKWISENKRNRANFYQMVTRLFPQEVAHSGEIKTNDPLIIRVIHIKGNDSDNGGNGDGKK